MRRALGIAVSVAMGLTIGGGALVLGATTASAAAPTFTVVATGLDSPRHLTVGPDGALYVALAGIGGPGSGSGGDCLATTNQAGSATFNCLGTTGAIARVTPSGAVTTALSGLPSVVTEAAAPIPTPEFAGPAAVNFVDGKLQVVTQVISLNPDGTTSFTGAEKANLARLITADPGSPSTAWSVGANFAAFAAANPQSPATAGPEPAFDSDPYAITPFNGGFAVADAAANALRFVSSTGVITNLASFPIVAGAQAVPTSVVTGPDGALYVGELLGAPSPEGGAVVYRVEPGHAPTIYASGFSAITDIAFDRAGRLLVLEFNTGGLLGAPTNTGAVIRTNADGSKTTLASDGLVEPTGMVVGPDGSIYVSNNGDTEDAGQIVRIPVASQDGYMEVASDGGAFNFGAYRFTGSLGGVKLVQPIVGASSTLATPGYWSVASDGGVFSFGANSFFGSLGGKALDKPIVGMAATPDSRGYWLVASDGGVFTFGDARFFGSQGGKPLEKPVVGIASTPTGGGYWLVASDGGIFTFGDAKFLGSQGGKPLDKPVVGIASTPSGNGYWEVASDGGIFTFGDATFHGSQGGKPLDQPIVGIQATANGAGYWEAASDGGIFAFGNAAFFGSMGGIKLVAPVVSFG